LRRLRNKFDRNRPIGQRSAEGSEGRWDGFDRIYDDADAIYGAWLHLMYLTFVNLVAGVGLTAPGRAGQRARPDPQEPAGGNLFITIINSSKKTCVAHNACAELTKVNY
jgi:hypothetical protein